MPDSKINAQSCTDFEAAAIQAMFEKAAALPVFIPRKTEVLETIIGKNIKKSGITHGILKAYFEKGSKILLMNQFLQRRRGK